MSYDIKTDIHTHTIFSRHAYSTIAENVAAARDAGLELLGSADHFSSMLYTEQDIRNFQYFTNQGCWPRQWGGVTLLRGIEVDIVSLDGSLFGMDIPCPCGIAGHPYRSPRSLYEKIVDGLDYLVASVHNGSFAADAPLAETTAMYVAALENPRVFVLGHTGRSGVPFDMDEVLTVAKERHKLIEINNHSLAAGGRHHAACRAIAERCAEMGVGITVSSDAHIALDIGRFPYAERLLDEVHFPEELIMNRDRDTLLDALAAAGVCDLRELKGGAEAAD